jgi:DNA-binding NtrC family response regulator/predicted ATPase
MAQPSPSPASHPTDRLLGRSPAISALRTQIRHLAAFDTVGSPHAPTVLLQGETGTGKGLVARVIHDSGPRAEGPFIDVNCAAIPETLLEAELFGFEAGTFTDAKRAKPGLLEAASGGTLFLDEIEALPLALQSKFLKAIEEKWVRRLGAVRGQSVDVKIIAATTADLGGYAAQGRFRPDLYHRLAVVIVTLPPLRERGEDLFLLAEQFLRRYTEAHGVRPNRLSRAAEAWLRGYRWPGNVRELSHLLERVTLLSREAIVSPSTLESLCLSQPPAPEPAEPTAGADASGQIEERAQIQAVLRQTRGNVVQAARLLGLSRGALRHRLRRYGLQSPGAREPAPAPSRDHFATGPIEKGRVEPTPERSATTSSTWEHKSVAALAIELTFPMGAEDESAVFEPWTTASRWEQAVVAKVQGFGGVVLQRSPSLLLVAFGIPRTLDQLPQRAVQAALALRQLVAEGAEGESSSALRLVLHWGEVLVDVQASDPTAQLRALGETLAWPVRLLGQTAPSDILLSPEMGPLVEGWCELQAREVSLHGDQAQRIGVYAVVGNCPPGARRELQGRRRRSPFAGRDQELATLRARVRQVEGGRGQVVGLIGEPGVGKSRLCDEFIRGALVPPWVILETQGTAYGQATPYLPVLGLLKGYFHINDRDDRLTIRDKVIATLRGLDEALTPTTPAFLTLLDVPVEDASWQALEAPQRRQRLLDAVKHLLLRESQRQPLLLVVEDLHWIDAETQAVLDNLVESLPTARILLLGSYRPKYRHGWESKTSYSQLRLDPLPPESVAELLQALLGDDADLTALKRLLVERTGGNPFFLEESVRTLVEMKSLVGEPGAYRLAQALPTIQVPATVQAVLAARIDRLPIDDKRLLQISAVIGKDVPFSLLQAVVERPTEALRQGVAQLQRAEFLYERDLFPELAYTFEHALTHEVAYQSMLKSTRQRDHQKIAETLEERFPERCGTEPKLLAHHYTEAGLVEQAIPYWQRAGQQALQRSANLEAVQHLTKGLTLLATLAETAARAQQELDLLIALGPALMATKGFAAPEVEQTYARARALCAQAGDTPQLFPTLRGLCRFYQTRGPLPTAREVGEQLYRLAQHAAVPTHLLEAHDALGVILFFLGDYAAARVHLEQGIALTDPTAERGLALRHGAAPGMRCLIVAADTLWCLGYPAQAVRRCEEALSLTQELANHQTLVMAQHWAAYLHHRRRDELAVQAQAEALLTLASAQGFPLYVGYGTCWRGWALAMQGQEEAGLGQMRQGMAAILDTGQTLTQPLCLVLMAEAMGHAGQIAEGLRLLGEALAVMADSGRGDLLAEAYRLQGEFLLRQAAPDAVQAEAYFQQALAVARRQQAKSWELRAATSLSRLWRQQGKRDEARQLLGGTYGWFTEGLDTADLQEAKMLLEESS